MSTITNNDMFVKPSLDDAADITQSNVNWDSLDTALHNINLSISNLRAEIQAGDDNVLSQVRDITRELPDIREDITQNTSDVTALENTLRQLISTEVAKLQPKISYGTAAPSGGSNGDIYIRLI
jgi:chromosome segregation ATPase